LRQKETEIFLQAGLDSPNHVDPTGEFLLKARAGELERFRAKWPVHVKKTRQNKESRARVTVTVH